MTLTDKLKKGSKKFAPFVLGFSLALIADKSGATEYLAKLSCTESSESIMIPLGRTIYCGLTGAGTALATCLLTNKYMPE